MPLSSASGLKVLLMTDLVGSVFLQQRLGTEAYAELKAQHDALVMGVVEQSPSGEILEQTGDAFFAHPKIQAALAERPEWQAFLEGMLADLRPLP